MSDSAAVVSRPPLIVFGHCPGARDRLRHPYAPHRNACIVLPGPALIPPVRLCPGSAAAQQRCEPCILPEVWICYDRIPEPAAFVLRSLSGSQKSGSFPAVRSSPGPIGSKRRPASSGSSSAHSVGQPAACQRERCGQQEFRQRIHRGICCDQGLHFLQPTYPPAMASSREDSGTLFDSFIFLISGQLLTWNLPVFLFPI